MKTLPENSIDLIVTDPPYGVNLKYDCYNDNEDNWYKLISSVLPEMLRVSKMVILQSCQIKKLKWFYNNYPPDWIICWYKGSCGQVSYIGFNDWEPILVYGRTRNRLYMHDYFQTKSSYKKGTFNHPCPKPLEWALWLIEKATKENDIILDPFVGSGTTCVAAKQLNRRWIGIDISYEYCKIASARLNNCEIVKFSNDTKINIPKVEYNTNICPKCGSKLFNGKHGYYCTKIGCNYSSTK